MHKTYLDSLVEFPVKALNRIGSDKTVVSLITNDPDIDMDSDAANDIFGKNLFDYGYVDDTQIDASAYICVEAEMPRVATPTMQNIVLYVTVICHKNYMKIDPKKFPGMSGNRRENLSRYVDSVLTGSDFLGIGRLSLSSIRTIPTPSGFSGRELIYKIPEFKTRLDRPLDL